MFNPNYLPYNQWSNQMLARRFPIKRLNGIPEMRTLSVATVDTVAVYQLCPWRFKQLCNEGLMLLHIAQNPPAGAVSTSLQTQSNPQTGSTGVPLTDTNGNVIIPTRLIQGGRILVYYNKCQGIFQIVNDLPV